jgi:hypothetical protein
VDELNAGEPERGRSERGVFEWRRSEPGVFRAVTDQVE